MFLFNFCLNNIFMISTSKYNNLLLTIMPYNLSVYLMFTDNMTNSNPVEILRIYYCIDGVYVCGVRIHIAIVRRKVANTCDNIKTLCVNGQILFVSLWLDRYPKNSGHCEWIIFVANFIHLLLN